MFSLSGYINGKIVTKIGNHKVLNIAWPTMLFLGIYLFTGYFLFGLNLAAILVPILLFFFSEGFVFVNCFSLAFADEGKNSGVATSIYSAIQTAGAVILGSISAHTHETNQLLQAVIIIAVAIISLILCNIVYRKTV